MTPFLCKNINALIQNYTPTVWLIWIIMIFLHISHSRLSEAMGVDEKSILEKVLKIRYYRQNNTKKWKKSTIIYRWPAHSCLCRLAMMEILSRLQKIIKIKLNCEKLTQLCLGWWAGWKGLGVKAGGMSTNYCAFFYWFEILIDSQSLEDAQAG